MQKLLLVFLLLCSHALMAQRGLVFVKKRGLKKVMSFAEGSTIWFKTRNGQEVRGILALVRNDSLKVNGNWYRSGDIASIVLRPKNGKAAPFLLTTAGVALSTAGMTLANWASFSEALGYSSAIGYGNYVIRYLPGALKRRHYPIGKKFRIQTLDLHF